MMTVYSFAHAAGRHIPPGWVSADMDSRDRRGRPDVTDTHLAGIYIEACKSPCRHTPCPGVARTCGCSAGSTPSVTLPPSTRRRGVPCAVPATSQTVRAVRSRAGRVPRLPTALAPSATPVPLPVLRGLPSTRPRPDDHEHRCPGRGGKASE